MNRLTAALLAVATTGLVAPAHAQWMDPNPTAPSDRAGAGPECPPFVRGARLQVTNVDGGVAFTITTKTAKYVDPLVLMLRQLGELIEEHSEVDAEAASTGNGLEVPPIDIGVRDVPQGARVLVTVQRSADIEQLRSRAKLVQKLWRASTCINGERTAVRGTTRA